MKTISEYEAEGQYQDFLDEVYGEINICGYTYSASDALNRVDPIAYRTGFNDWLANEELEVE